MSCRPMIVTDCGTSRTGISIFIALVSEGDRYVAGADTLTVSVKVATCRVSVRNSAPDVRAVTATVNGAKPSSSTVTAWGPGVRVSVTSPLVVVTPASLGPGWPVDVTDTRAPGSGAPVVSITATCSENGL